MRYVFINDRITAEITYRRGRLAAVDVKKGELDFEMLSLVVPAIEKHVDTNVLLPAETKEQKNAFYRPALEEWNRFYTTLTGIEYRFTAADGVALSKIGDHLRTLASGRTDLAVDMWKFILHKWSHLSDFYRKSPDLKFINSQLNKIILEVKHGQQGAGTAPKRDDADDLRRSFTS